MERRGDGGSRHRFSQAMGAARASEFWRCARSGPRIRRSSTASSSNFPPMRAFPKPVQKGGPPVLLGSEAKRCFERVVDYCDGWMPIYRRNHTLAEGVKQLRETASHAGRRFESLKLTVFAVPPREEEVKKLVEIGFHEIIFRAAAGAGRQGAADARQLRGNQAQARARNGAARNPRARRVTEVSCDGTPRRKSRPDRRRRRRRAAQCGRDALDRQRPRHRDPVRA